jgi:hypothetical protein
MKLFDELRAFLFSSSRFRKFILLRNFYKFKYSLLRLKKIKNPVSGYIVSLTTVHSRINTVHFTIYSLLCQSIRPEKIVLWVSENSYGYDEGISFKEIPKVLQDLVSKNKNFEIKFCENFGPHTKLIPSLRFYSGFNIITADDDVLYPSTWAQDLIKASNKNLNSIVCHCARKIKIKEGSFLKYKDWPHAIQETKGLSLLPLGTCGVLYPFSLNKFYGELIGKKPFVAPFADDIEFRNFFLLKKVSVLKIGNYKRKGFDFGFAMKTQLHSENLYGQRNDLYLEPLYQAWAKIILDEKIG